MALRIIIYNGSICSLPSLSMGQIAFIGKKQPTRRLTQEHSHTHAHTHMHPCAHTQTAVAVHKPRHPAFLQRLLTLMAESHTSTSSNRIKWLASHHRWIKMSPKPNEGAVLIFLLFFFKHLPDAAVWKTNITSGLGALISVFGSV